MNKHREELLDRVIAKFGHEHLTTIEIAEVLEKTEESHDNELLLDIIVSLTLKN
jgi:hypothetical protein